MEKRFRALRIVGTLYKVLGVLSGIVSLIIVVGACVTAFLGGNYMNEIARQLGYGQGVGGMMGGVGGIAVAFMSLIYGGGAAITLYGFGEAVYLLIAVEENTRAVATALEAQAGSPPMVP